MAALSGLQCLVREAGRLYYERGLISHLFFGEPPQPTAMALRPGPLPSSSFFTPTASLTAGTPYQTALTLRAYANSHLSPTLTASLTIPYVGNFTFTVAVTEGLQNPQTLRDGAFQVTVNPGATDPASCEADFDFDQVLTAGSSFSLNITTMDAYRNPTEGASFSCCARTRAVHVLVLQRRDRYQGWRVHRGRYSCHQRQPVPIRRQEGRPSRSHLNPQHCLHGARQREGDPPGASCVAQGPGEANGAKTGEGMRRPVGLKSHCSPLCSHRLPLCSHMCVAPFAHTCEWQFGNTIADANGYTVSIDGETRELSAPDFSYKHTILADYEGDIELAFTFTLNGANNKGSLVIVRVSPSAEAIGTDFALVAAIGVTVIVQKFSNKKIEFEEEKAVTPDEQLQKVCDTLIQGQQAWLAFELVDAFSHIANGVMAVVEGTMSPTFLIGVFGVFAGINAIVKRSQVIYGVRKIKDGDEETMKKFKDGGEGGIVTVDDPALQWELTMTAELLVSELAATNGVLEDFPSSC